MLYNINMNFLNSLSFILIKASSEEFSAEINRKPLRDKMMKAFASEGREGEEELNHASERLFSLGSALRADFTAVNLTAGAVLA